MYKLNYKRGEELFVLSGVKACDSFIFNLYVSRSLNIFIQLLSNKKCQNIIYDYHDSTLLRMY